MLKHRLIAIGDIPKGFQVQLGYMCSWGMVDTGPGHGDHAGPVKRQRKTVRIPMLKWDYDNNLYSGQVWFQLVFYAWFLCFGGFKRVKGLINMAMGQVRRFAWYPSVHPNIFGGWMFMPPKYGIQMYTVISPNILHVWYIYLHLGDY